MKIVILNECFLSESEIQELSLENQVEIYDVTQNKKDAKNRMKDADIIFVDQFICPITNDILDCASKLKLIILNTTSYHLVDIKYLQQRGITLCNTPDFCSTSVAELVFFYALSLARNTQIAFRDNYDKPFEILPDDVSHRKYVGYNLRGKTLGILGLGNIGQKVSEIARGFGMNIIGYNRSQKNIKNIEQLPLEKVLSQSDIVVITLPYSQDTENLIHSENIKLLKNGVIIINISSHEIIEEKILIEGIESGDIAGYGLDNFTNKDKSHYFYNSDKVIILPHLGFFSQESLDMIGVRMMEGYRGFIEGKSSNKIV